MDNSAGTDLHDRDPRRRVRQITSVVNQNFRLRVYLAKPLELEKYTVVVTTTGEYLFEGVSQEIKVGSVLYTYNAHYEAKTDPGRSFILIGEEWVDVTDSDIMTRLGLDGIPAFEGITSPGDPCITVLFY